MKRCISRHFLVPKHDRGVKKKGGGAFAWKSLDTDLNGKSIRLRQQAKQETQEDQGRIHCCVSVGSTPTRELNELLASSESIYPLLLLCSELIGRIFYDGARLRPPHHPLCVIYSSPLLIRNRWSRCWPSLVPRTYCSACWGSALSEIRHLRCFFLNSAVATGRITVHPVQQTGNLCLTVPATGDFVIDYQLITVLATII